MGSCFVAAISVYALLEAVLPESFGWWAGAARVSEPVVFLDF
jgi:hypothetical protein